MRYSVNNRLFLLKNHFISTMREHRKKCIGEIILLLVGVALGIYIGVKVGAKETPFGFFARLFRLEYTPFRSLFPDFLRFLLFAAIASLAFFLPFPTIYPASALFFFGKYFGEIACVCMISDSIVSSLLSILIIYLPLLLIGSVLILYIAQYAKESRILCGSDPCRKSIWKMLFHAMICIGIYLVVLFLLYVIICGLVYLIVFAL